MGRGVARYRLCQLLEEIRERQVDLGAGNLKPLHRARVQTAESDVQVRRLIGSMSQMWGRLCGGSHRGPLAPIDEVAVGAIADAQVFVDREPSLGLQGTRPFARHLLW